MRMSVCHSYYQTQQLTIDKEHVGLKLLQATQGIPGKAAFKQTTNHSLNQSSTHASREIPFFPFIYECLQRECTSCV